MTAVRDAALDYASRGFSVLPLRPNDKKPALLDWKPLQKKAWGAKEINEWWASNPDHGVGILTGKISGFDAIDLDGPHARDLLLAVAPTVPKTLAVKTPHGNHVYIEHDSALKQGAAFLTDDCEKQCQVDVRSEGGYVVAPPTVIGEAEYSWVTEHPIAQWEECVTALLASRNGTKPTPLPVDRQPRWVASALIEGAPEGQRNETATRLAGYFHAHGMPEDVVLATLKQFADACSPPMDYVELDGVIKSVSRYAQGGPQPFLWQGDTIPPPEAQFLADNRVRFHWQEQGLTITLERVKMKGESIPCLLTVSTDGSGILYGPIRFDLMSGTQRTTARRAMPDLFAWEGYFNYLATIVRDHHTQIEPTVDLATVLPKGQAEWLIQPLVRGTKPYIVFGDGGAGKSTVCLAIALSLAIGRGVIPGIDVNSEGQTLYLDYEQEDEDVAATLFALAAGMNEAPRGVIYQRMAAPVADHVEQIKRTVKEHGIRLLIIDHIVAACGGDAKDEDSARIFFAALREIGVASISVGHVAKGNDKTVYGSTFWTNFARGMFKIEGFQEPNSNVNHIEIFNTKNNRDTLMRPLAFNITYVGEDPDLSIVFKTADIQSDSETAKRLGWVARVTAVLKGGALTAAEIATELDEPREVVSRELGRAGRKDTHWAMLTGTLKWGLLAHHIPRDMPRDGDSPPRSLKGSLGDGDEIPRDGKEKERDDGMEGKTWSPFSQKWV